MLQTIYESESRIPAEWLRNILDTHSISDTVIGQGSEVLSPVGRSEVSMPEWERDSDDWEKQLQRELLLIQRQQQIQKQLLIAEFQKQHQALLRQHQAQLQEHIKLQQALLTLRQQQEALAEEHMPKTEEEREETQGEEQERHRREQTQHQHLNNRKKEHAKDSAMASTEVRQKLHDFLLSKSAKDASPSGYPLNQRSNIWYIASQHMSMEQSSPPLGETPPKFKSPLPSGLDNREDFPLRKTASEPNLKVRSRLKQKVSERRSGPIPRRRDGSVLVTPPKKRPLELSDSSANDSSPSSGPSSPVGLCGTENGATYQVSTAQIEQFLPEGGIVKADGSMALLNLYTSPSLPNLTLGLYSGASPISSASPLKDRAGEMGTMPSVSREQKVNTSHQALLQHLLLKEQNKQQKLISSGGSSLLPQSPLVMKDHAAGGTRPRLPRHRPLNRTQSAPLPQSTLAQLVLQQQHQNFVEKQKRYHQQVHINQMLSQSIEQLRNPTSHLEEDEDTRGVEFTLPPAGVIRSHNSSIHLESSATSEASGAQASVIRVKEEPLDAESRMEEGGAERGAAENRDTEAERSEEQELNLVPMLPVKSEQNVDSMTETEV